MNINLHIDRLVLEGLPVAHNESQLLEAALETELTRLLVADGQRGRLDFSSCATPHVAAPGIQLMSNSSSKLGEQIARSVYVSMNHAGTIQ